MAKKKKAHKPEDYLCLSAMLRAREPKLLDNARAERMLDAGSFEEAAKMLTDCGFPDLSQMTANQIDAALDERRNGILAEVERMVPDREAVDVFRIKYDYHNAKTILKSEAVGQSPDRLLSGAGRVNKDVLLNAYREEQLKDLPETLAKAMEEAKTILARTANPQLADFALDKAYFSELRKTADDTGSAFLKDYVSMLVDSTNLRTAVRTLRMGKSAEFMSGALAEGGKVSKNALTAVTDGDGLKALYAGKPLDKAAALGAEALGGGSLTKFELACDNAVNACLRKAKLVSFGMETVVAYLAAVEEETTAARMILTGRKAGVAPETIKERLRDLYA